MPVQGCTLPYLLCICSGITCVVLWTEVSYCVCSFFGDAVSGRVACNVRLAYREYVIRNYMEGSTRGLI